MASPDSLVRAATTSATFRNLLVSLTLFPLRAILPGPSCTCREGARCGSIGKHPAVFWGQLAAGEKIFSDDLTCGYGIATGARSGLFVVDIDGPDAATVLETFGEIPETFTVESPRQGGGWHLWYRAPSFSVATSAGVLAPGVDVRGDGGFVVAPGSPHKSGGMYRVVDDRPLAPAPAWLLKLPGVRLKRPAVHAGPGAAEVEAAIGPRVPKAWRIARARAWLATRPPAIEGAGGDRATWQVVLRAIKSCCLTDLDMAIEALADWNARCVPPWGGDAWHRNIERAIASEHVPWEQNLNMTYALEEAARANLARVA